MTEEDVVEKLAVDLSVLRLNADLGLTASDSEREAVLPEELLDVRAEVDGDVL